MEKERVTRRRITHELVRIHKEKLISLILVIALFFVMFFWLPLGLFGVKGMLIYLGVLMLIGLPFAIYYIRRISRIKKKKYYIFSDKLMGYGSDDIPDSSRTSLGRDKKYELHFAGVSPYVMYVDNSIIRKRMYYRWSETFAMTAEGVYNTSMVGDEFYIVSIDNHTAELFFNKKFFEVEK